jgi:hypothetical protein
VRVLSNVRSELVERHTRMFRRAGAKNIQVIDTFYEGKSFGEVLAGLAPAHGGAIVFSGGAVPLLNKDDVDVLMFAAETPERVASTNNRYSSDVVAVARARILRDLPPLPSDNALPRWLEERAGYGIAELGSQNRLGLDLDTPQDVALVSLAARAPRWLKRAAVDANLVIPRLDGLRALAADPHRELLVFGRSSSKTLAWLERNVRCRVRFLAEERGMRASSPLAVGGPQLPAKQRRPVATLGLLLDQRGPTAFGDLVSELADGAIVDTRVLLAHRLGADEAAWPSDGDRFASDLHRAAEVHDPWLCALTESAAASRLPILLGGHSLVGPGVRLLLG